MSTATRVSYGVIAAMLLLVGWFGMGALVLSALFSYFLLCRLQFAKNRWIAVMLFVVLVAAAGYAAGRFVNAALIALPKIADSTIPTVITWAEERRLDFQVPFTDYQSLKHLVIETVREQVGYLRNFANFAQVVTMQLVYVVIGMVVASSVFLNSRINLDRETPGTRNSFYGVCCQEIMLRFRNFYESFATVMGAQIVISAINTVPTSIFVFAFKIPYAPLLVGVTFLCGLLPVIGNLISNTVIVALAFTLSPKMALGALIFLVVIHKLEYFLNSKIIGDRIRNPIWLTLLGLIIGEKVMGIPGMILAPVILYFLKVEGSRIPFRGAAPQAGRDKERREKERKWAATRG